MTGASARYSCFCTPVETSTPPRRSKLRIVRFAASGKAHSLRCSSSPHKAWRAALRGPHFGASSVSFASPQAARLIHSDAPPLPTKPGGRLCGGPVLEQAPYRSLNFIPSPVRESPRPGCPRSLFSFSDLSLACRSSPVWRPQWRPPSPCPQSPCRRPRSRRPGEARRPP